MPVCRAKREGRLVMKSQLNRSTPKYKIKARKIPKIQMAVKVVKIPNPLNSLSFLIFEFGLLIFFLISVFNPITHIIQNKRKNKEGDTGRKNSFIRHRSVSNIATGYLHDE